MSLQEIDDLRIAIVVNPTLPVGLLANTIATIGIGLGAGQPAFGNAELRDRPGLAYLTSANRPVPVLQAASDAMQALMIKASSSRATDSNLVLFPAFARKLHSFNDYRNAISVRDLKEEQIDGIGLYGPTRWIRSLTGSLKLLK